MSKKLAGHETVKQENRVSNGWDLEVIRKNAEKELKKYNTIAENEPGNLVSGRMGCVFEDQEPDED